MGKWTNRRGRVPASGLALLMAGLGGCGGGDTTNVTQWVSPVAVSAVYPAEAKPGEPITVRGQNFGSLQGASTLSIDGVPVTHIASWSDTRIEATVPAGATTGNVSVAVDGVTGAPGYLVVPWETENPANVPISAAAGNQESVQTIPDGAGGAFMVWRDLRAGLGGDIYAQRVDRRGEAQWTADGVAITAATVQPAPDVPHLASDGAGGAIVVWADHRSGGSVPDIYAQRIDGSGQALWAAGGVVINSSADYSAYFPQLVADGAGGAIIVWRDNRTGTPGIYAQRVNAAGQALWQGNGIAISEQPSAQVSPRLAADGAGGAIVVWQDLRGGINQIYAQRVDGAGQVQWAADGIPLAQDVGEQEYPRLVADGAGGAIVVWQDARTDAGDIYAQRIDAAGQVQWDAAGVAFSIANRQQSPDLVAIPGSGAVAVWVDEGTTGDANLYAQRLNRDGAFLWSPGGVPVTAATGYQGAPQIAADDASGAIVVWRDSRSGTQAIYAQRVNGNGAVQWTQDGEPVSTAVNGKGPPQVARDGFGGAIVVWPDFRDGTSDIYAQGITANGRQ